MVVLERRVVSLARLRAVAPATGRVGGSRLPRMGAGDARLGVHDEADLGPSEDLGAGGGRSSS